MTEKIHTMSKAVLSSIEHKRYVEYSHKKIAIYIKRLCILCAILVLIMIIILVLSKTVFNDSDMEQDSLFNKIDDSYDNSTLSSTILNPSYIPQITQSVSGTATATASATPTATPTTTPTSTVTSVMVRESSGDNKKFGDNIYQVIGIFIIALIIVMLLIGLCSHCRDKKRNQIKVVPRRIIYEVE